MKVTGAQALFRSLEGEGVDIVFGIPGGAILPAYDPLIDSKVRHVLCRHEQGAGHAAEGYAWATGKVGVAIATSGPAACNLVTRARRREDGLGPDGRDHRPGPDAGGRQRRLPGGRHHRASRCRSPSTTSWSRTRTSWPRALREAFHIARTGRPGPVLVDIPKDVQLQEFEWRWPESVDLPGYRPTTKGNLEQVRSAAAMIMASERPVLYVGGGVIKAEAHEGAPRARRTTGGSRSSTTLMARGAFPDTHELALGHAGHARRLHGGDRDAEGRPAGGARLAVRRPGDRQARHSFATDAKIIHVDIDPAEIGKNRAADVPIVGDCKDVIAKLHTELRAPAGRGRRRAGSDGVARPARRVEADLPVPLRPAGRRAAQAAVLHRAPVRAHRRATRSSSRAWASTRCGRRSSGGSPSRAPG